MKRLLLVLVVGLVMGADSPKDTQVSPATLKITAEQLQNTYWTNEIHADDLYKGKTLEVRGWLGRVKRKAKSDPNFGSYQVELWPFRGWDERRPHLKFYFHENQRKQLAELDAPKKPQRLVVIGTCRGLYEDEAVAFEDCKIVSISGEEPIRSP